MPAPKGALPRERQSRLYQATTDLNVGFPHPRTCVSSYKGFVLLADLVKVIHHNNEHLLCLSSEEAALLLDLCHAGVISDHLSPARSRRKRLEKLVGDLQGALHATAQAVWRRQTRSPLRETAR
ncbi:MAG: hypothetical protein ACK6BC_12550 [Cyanobacteriota bacterium]|jgi:hypothetical protein